MSSAKATPQPASSVPTHSWPTLVQWPAPPGGKSSGGSYSHASVASSAHLGRLPSRHVPTLLIRRSRIAQTELAPRNRPDRFPASH